MGRLKQAVRASLDAYFTARFDRMSAQLSAELTALLDPIRQELVEVERMLRQQGDAADQVAEALGRTLVRLSAEVEDLSEALVRAEGRLDRIETSA